MSQTRDEKRDFVDWLAWELRAAIDAKTITDVEVDFWRTLYKQARTRLSRNTPWPDAVDFTSYIASEKIASEKVNAVHARILRMCADWRPPDEGHTMSQTRGTLPELYTNRRPPKKPKKS